MPAHMGWLFYRITFSGKPIHCAFKWKGVNAVDKCLDFMCRMREVERNWAISKRHPYLPPPTLCFTVIHGGDSSSTVPEKCVLDMSLHFHPCETENGRIGSRIDAQLRDEIARFVGSDPWLSANPPQIECFQQGNAYDIGKEHPIVTCVRGCLESCTGRRPEIQGLASGADARLLTNFADTPTVLCGPGSIDNAHSINEYVPVDEYLAAVHMFCKLFTEWCGTAESAPDPPPKGGGSGIFICALLSDALCAHHSHSPGRLRPWALSWRRDSFRVSRACSAPAGRRSGETLPAPS